MSLLLFKFSLSRKLDGNQDYMQSVKDLIRHFNDQLVITYNH